MLLNFLFTIVLSVLLDLITPKPKFEDAKALGLGEFDFPTASEARKIPLLWGTVQVTGPNLVWYGDYAATPITKKVQTSPFSSKKVIVGYRYFVGKQFALCRGEIDGLRRVWIGEDLVYDDGLLEHGDTFLIDEPELFGGQDTGSGGYVGEFEVFTGTADQAASTYLADFCQEGGDTPAYRGTAYVASYGDHAYVGNSEQIRAWKFEVSRIHVDDANPLGLADPSVNTLDANPMNVIYEILTDTEWGMKIPTADIDATAFVDVAAVLKAEGNGFSFFLDKPEEAQDLLQRIESQIDGVVFQDDATGKWTIKLARDDYDIDDAVSFDASNIVEIDSFNRGTWEGTTNIVGLEYVHRDDEYKVTYATAQSMANIRIQEGNLITSPRRYGGVFEPTLANALAWRDLRALSIPLAQATIVTDRSTHEVTPLEVVKVSFTRGDVTVTDLPMRVKSINRGSLGNGRIVYKLTQDVFRTAAGSFGDPAVTGWVDPVAAQTAFPVEDQLAIEAPRAITARDPFLPSPYYDVILAGARKHLSSSQSFEVYGRHALGTPSGDFVDVGTGTQFLLIGELAEDLEIGDGVPLSSLTINSTPSAQAAILEAFPEVTDDTDLGTNIQSLILIGDEFMLPLEASAGSGSQVDFDDVYRGALDSVQGAHTTGAKVWLLFAGAALTEGAFPSNHNVGIKLLPRSIRELLDVDDATEIAVAMSNRTRRPYAPSKMRLDGQDWRATVSLEGDGTGEDDGIPLIINRRDFRTLNEVASLEADAGTLYTDFPAANATTHEVDVINDPDGAATLLFTDDFADANEIEVRRLEILKYSGGVLPTRLRFAVRATHTFEGVEYDSREDLVWDFDVTTSLTGDFNLGSIDVNDVSNAYTADAGGTHSFSMSSSFGSGNVQYRIDTGGGFGSWTTLIGAGTTSGSIAGVVIGDVIEIRHQGSGSDAIKLLTMNAPGAGTDAYAIVWN